MPVSVAASRPVRMGHQHTQEGHFHERPTIAAQAFGSRSGKKAKSDTAKSGSMAIRGHNGPTQANYNGRGGGSYNPTHEIRTN